MLNEEMATDNTENTDKKMLHHDLTEKIIGVFYDVYNELGHGFLESVYETAMMIALNDKGLRVEQQVEVPVWFRGRQIGTFYADLLGESVVIVELKAVRSIDPSHEAQLLHYLRATEIELGLLLNFGVRPEIKRKIYDSPRKKSVSSV
ncbi:MAG: GxxExxY protein [Pyrinomonadaceae bacterium]